MKKKRKMSVKENLDLEEKEILSSFEKDEWVTIKNVEEQKKFAKQTAAKSLRKDVRINIRLSSNDVASLKQIAAFEGLPYQTLISSILHKYAAGHLSL